ncbi:hypothetical protein THRCLA_23120 [Thraustotheca clavata]|uniref:SGNH domain-containing protein n=1 Tax=Thraustotheca clavata TaxID=74557 RepID=A0A1V9YDQ2_9STRA|nr:hypothetical protein THRCLA_23120 [Thraustotheca clavata]
MVLVSLVLSVLTYEDVEKRLRRRKSKMVTPLLVLGVVVLGILALFVYNRPESYSSIELELAQSTMEEDETLDFGSSSVTDSDLSSTQVLSSGNILSSNSTWTMVETESPVVEVKSTEVPTKSSSIAASLDHTEKPPTTPIEATTAPKAATLSPRATVIPVANENSPIVTQPAANQDPVKMQTLKPVAAVATTAPVHAKAKVIVEMVRNAVHDLNWNDGAGEMCEKNSSYITTEKLLKPFPYNDPTFSGYPETCQILNKGHEDNGVLVVLGDSHADMSKARFVKLYKDARRSYKPFPTVVFKTRWGRAMLPCRPEFPKNIEMVKSIKPQAVLFVIHWVQYINPGGRSDRPYTGPPNCCLIEGQTCKEQNMDDVTAIFKIFQEEVSKLTAMGIKVFVVDQSPEYEDMSPNHWINGDSVKVPKPHSHSSYKKEKGWLLNLIHSAVIGANATLIDYADNYSHGDTVEFTDDKGHPIMSTVGHITTYTARNYLTVVDQVVNAATLSH